VRAVICRFLLLRDRAQYIAGSGDVRQVDLGLDFVFGVSGDRPGWPVRRCGTLGVAAEPLTYKLSFVIFKRAGMRFFLGDTDLGQHVKNRLALDLQLTGQIIDSNLHPLPFPLPVPLGPPLIFLTLAYLASGNSLFAP
jgi:hypothetical protein